jgi:hypothetical protein
VCAEAVNLGNRWWREAVQPGNASDLDCCGVRARNVQNQCH